MNLQQIIEDKAKEESRYYPEAEAKAFLEGVEFLKAEYEGCTPDEVKKMREVLNDCNELLAYFEDFVHGQDGDKITELRSKIRAMNLTAEEILDLHKVRIFGAHRNRIFDAMKAYAEQEVRKHLEIAAGKATTKNVLCNNSRPVIVDKSSITGIKIELT